MPDPTSDPRQNDSLARLAAALSGRYEIEREIGAGGMATVYLARDVRHERHVALKVLSPELGAVLGAERFLSEIRVTANLQHPNLLPLFDSGEVDGLLFYVMPFVEGETLRHRLDRERQLPVDEAVRLAIAIAGALDYAHQHGVIHRDLKPENILLQHEQPIVADFGIALAVSNAGGQRVTQTGLSLGTPQYMSPEQATGDRIIDARSDVYSLGAMTYEMLAGEPPHSGTSAQAIIARLMTESPRPLTLSRPTVPDNVDDAVRCALEKLPADRFSTAGEFAAALRGGTTLSRPTRTRHAPTGKGHRSDTLTRGALAFVSLIALLLAGLLLRERSRPEQPRFRFAVDLPPGQQVAIGLGSAVTISPDGRAVAYVASSRGAAPQRIYVRPLDSLYPRAVPGTDGANMPRFSPDGRWLAFLSPTDLRRVPLAGGGAEIITSSVAGSQNFAFGPDGDVVLARDGALWHIGARDSATRLTTPDTTHGEVSHAVPLFLDRKTIAFWLQKPTTDGALRGIGITSLSGGTHSVVDVPGDKPLAYIPGYLLLSNQSGAILAYPFDLKGRRVTGPPTAVLDSAVWIATGGVQAHIGRDGSLVYLRGSSGRRLAVLDERGSVVAETPELRDYRTAAIAPDGRHVAVAVGREMMGGRNASNSDIWIWDVESRGLVRLTTDGGAAPDWSADGKRIAFIRTTTGRGTAGGARSDAWWMPADGSSPEQRLPFPGLARVTAIRVTPSGKSAVVVARDSSTQEDLYLVSLTTPDAPPIPLAHSRFREIQPLISPDGRSLAYRSNETGRFELYVQSLEGAAARVRVSTAGSGLAVWASSGHRLIYYAENGATLAATLSVSGSSISVVRTDTVEVDRGAELRDLASHSNRVLVAREPTDRRIIVVPNWLREVSAQLRGR